jgi:hypothetical protein
VKLVVESGNYCPPLCLDGGYGAVAGPGVGVGFGDRSGSGSGGGGGSGGEGRGGSGSGIGGYVRIDVEGGGMGMWRRVGSFYNRYVLDLTEEGKLVVKGNSLVRRFENGGRSVEQELREREYQIWRQCTENLKRRDRKTKLKWKTVSEVLMPVSTMGKN